MASRRTERRRRAEVIDLAQRRTARAHYDARCEEIVERLLEFDREVADAAVDLAMLGAWRAWDAQQAPGTVVVGADSQGWPARPRLWHTLPQGGAGPWTHSQARSS